jgi:hypothetical protein
MTGADHSRQMNLPLILPLDSPLMPRSRASVDVAYPISVIGMMVTTLPAGVKQASRVISLVPRGS